MKMTKKILLGAAALVAALAFVGCGEKAEDSDPNNMIQGSGSKYSIDYTNEDAEQTSRGFKETKLKHAGGLVKITIDQLTPTAGNGGVMGFIFDLKKNADNAAARDFFIIGVRNDNKYYVSKFTNVTDMQAENFGTKLEENPAVEKQLDPTSGVFSNLSAAMPKDDNGNQYVYVYAFGNTDGSFNWKILNASATEKVKNLSDKDFSSLEITSDMVLAEGTIPKEDTGYTSQTQNKLAVYSNVYKSGTVVGSWEFVGTYKEAEILE